ncbi:MAG TPA: hypothetical protein VK943_06320 [Arenibaculum sp.]|nr:hypothetical protein [Arenibaculum sp.]
MAVSEGFLIPDPISPFYDPDKSNKRLYDISSYLAVAAASADHLISMLMSVVIGLFVMVGFALRLSFSVDRHFSWLQIFAYSAFLVCAFFAMVLGYAARIQMFELINTANTDFSNVQITMGRQAFFVSLSAILAVAAVSVSFLIQRHAQDVEDSPKPLPPGVASHPDTSGDPKEVQPGHVQREGEIGNEPSSIHIGTRAVDRDDGSPS